MTRPVFIIICFALFHHIAWSQLSDSAATDSSKLLSEVIIQAFAYDRPLQDVPAAIGYISKADFERFGNSSLLPAINTIPGVRMEERSPGSYRLSIRGSTLRSPFGIRNVKVYWNDLPFTDPGGNTYLNLLDFSSVQSAEVIKGPGGSLYGAGTGGVLLLKGPNAKFDETKVNVSSLVGSYGLLRYTASGESGDENANTIVQYAHQQADGYRQQSAMVRDVIQAQGRYRIDDKRIINTNLLYSDLAYQTPGGINKAQFDENPALARQPGGPFAGAVDQKTAIYNKTFFGGITHEYRWRNGWSNNTGVYGSFTQFENPFIDNYEKRTEQSVGGRTNVQYEFKKGKVNFGGEFQHGFSPISVYDNNAGTTGDLQNSNEITSNASLLFSQVEIFLPAGFFLTAGTSLNFFDIRYTRLSDSAPFSKRKKFDSVISPRIALLKKLDERTSLFGSVSRGFSPPTVAEIFPSTAAFNSELNPEQGTNLEAGTRSIFFEKRLNVDITAYSFQLSETIVVRRNEAGSDYFVNAGKTNQRGLEAQISWHSLPSPQNFINSFDIWTSFSLNHYRFGEYAKDTIEYNNNALTGVPPVIMVGGIDLLTGVHIYTNITVTYTDKIPLNDVNSVFSDAYTLLGARIGYRNKVFKKITLDIYAGVDNVLDERYSLGNDLNAFGGRYFNAAAPVNFYGGLSAGISMGK